MTRAFSYFLDSANDALAAGFTSKAAQRRAQEDVSRAFRFLRDAASKSIRDGAPYQNSGAQLTEENWIERGEYFAANDLPFDLHQIRDRHVDLMAGHGVDADQTRLLIDLRAAIKAAPVVKPETDKTAERKAKLTDSIRDLMERRGEQYNRALALGEIFGGLPVTANVHLVVNEHGTRFMRAFYYLDGEFTPINVIMAAADELARRADA